MRRVLYIESACRGLLTVNGQFCGPLEGEGQAFPMSAGAQVYIQFHPYGREQTPLAAVLETRGGQLTRLEPQENCFALLWPDGVIQLELRLGDDDRAEKNAAEHVTPDTLLRYLMMKMAGDERADQLLMAGASGVDLGAYSAAVPLRFAPVDVPDRFDERAGLVRRILPNAAAVDAALACTVPAGQGKRMIERIEIRRTHSTA